MGVSDEWVEAEEDLAERYTRNLAASMRQIKDAAILPHWGALDEIYEEDFPNPEEETK